MCPYFYRIKMPKCLCFKRVFDFSLSVAGLFFSLPLWVMFALAIWLEDARGVLYSQERVGKGGRIFRGLKFRSMIPDAEKGVGPVQAKTDDPRITRVGKILRATAMDELPQLVNIARGDMSFVGPRALRPKEIELTPGAEAVDMSDIPGFKKRTSIRPGLTGFAQVFASRNLPREEKFKYDVWYVENMSFWLDIKLILKSFAITFNAKWDT